MSAPATPPGHATASNTASEAVASRVVLVTGGSRGIGASCVDWFLARGDRVAATSRSGVVRAGDDGPERLLALKCDVGDPEQVQAAFAAIEERWGPVEILVSNAGITRDSLMLRMDEADWGDVIDTNLSGAYRIAKRAVAKMLRLHRGRIIFVSSVAAYLGSPGQVNYAASKAGLTGMARALAREVASRGITVNVVAPGMVDTEMLSALGAERHQQMAASIPLGRLGAPEDVAEVIGFLASSGAAYVTGAVVAVDGGMSMGL